jgi:hypothetical protein
VAVIKEVSGSYSRTSRTSLDAPSASSSSRRVTTGREGTSYEPVMDSKLYLPPDPSVGRTAPLLDGSRDEFMLTGVHKNSDAAANWVLTMDRFGRTPFMQATCCACPRWTPDSWS